MFETLKMKLWQKNQYIPDIKEAQMRKQFRGLPKLCDKKCDNCAKCLNVCPTGALSLRPLKIDLAKCTLCGACKNICEKSGKNGVIDFTNFYKLGVDSPEKLVITSDTTIDNYYKNAIEIKKEIYSIFNRSIKFRQVSAGGCNGCEMELNAAGNANFDMGRFGIDFVASPRHSDGIVITGPITKNMAYALEDC